MASTGVAHKQATSNLDVSIPEVYKKVFKVHPPVHLTLGGSFKSWNKKATLISNIAEPGIKDESSPLRSSDVIQLGSRIEISSKDTTAFLTCLATVQSALQSPSGVSQKDVENAECKYLDNTIKFDLD
ncbi:hypothetical protein CEXT_704551 [Caerostris extrusa]|uniref:Uncharacterized protein n=1 Tax=Caerostris extrusa TaxID=172846 RepID=A0AAV4NR60_CAEEX|nr:hypothetical protein CEXT_704551 [Caerostris extrusa]